MNDSNYTHTCQVCNERYTPTLNKDGTPYKTKHKICSQKCRERHKRIGNIDRQCKACGVTFRRRKRKNDAALYCSRECGYESARLCGTVRTIREEIVALHRISANVTRIRFNRLVRPELRALSNIRRFVINRTIVCKQCNHTILRRRAFFSYCNDACQSLYIRERKAQYKKTESYRSAKRAAKSKRRALIRGASDGQPIDPIKVFERDKWLCHICGNKTIKSKRGTIHDRAPELEHIISLADGGTHTWGNVACSCRKCNGLKGAESFGQVGFNFAN